MSVLAVGGVGATGASTSETDLYDPSSATWQRTGDLPAWLYWPAVIALDDGRVLLVRGARDSSLSRQILTCSPAPR